jgi:hypothetical protein
MRMRQSLAQLEQAFVEEMALDRTRRRHLREKAAARARQRRLERTHKHGSLRYTLLVLSLIATAVAVTIAMFETLSAVMG